MVGLVRTALTDDRQEEVLDALRALYVASRDHGDVEDEVDRGAALYDLKGLDDLELGARELEGHRVTRGQHAAHLGVLAYVDEDLGVRAVGQLHSEDLLGVIALELRQIHSPVVAVHGGFELDPAPGLAALLYTDPVDGNQELTEIPYGEAVVANKQAKVVVLPVGEGSYG